MMAARVVVVGVVGLAFGGSYPKTLDNCVLLQLAVREDGLQAVVGGPHVEVVELGHYLLAEPKFSSAWPRGFQCPSGAFCHRKTGSFDSPALTDASGKPMCHPGPQPL